MFNYEHNVQNAPTLTFMSSQSFISVFHFIRSNTAKKTAKKPPKNSSQPNQFDFNSL